MLGCWCFLVAGKPGISELQERAKSFGNSLNLGRDLLLLPSVNECGASPLQLRNGVLFRVLCFRG